MQQALHDAAFKSSAMRQLRLTMMRHLRGQVISLHWQSQKDEFCDCLLFLQVGVAVTNWRLTVLSSRHNVQMGFLVTAEAQAQQQYSTYREEVLRLTQRVSELEPLEDFFNQYDDPHLQ